MNAGAEFFPNEALIKSVLSQCREEAEKSTDEFIKHIPKEKYKIMDPMRAGEQ